MTTFVTSLLDPANALKNDIVAAGDGWTCVVKCGQTLRIIDLEGNQAVDTMFYDAHNPSERYCAVTTLRSQQRVYLSTGTQLMSGHGNPLMTITADTCGRHDTLGGACAAESNAVRYSLDKIHMHNCRDTFLLALARYSQKTGIPFGKRDLSSNVNFFMNVPVTPAGGLTFADGVSEAGKYVELVANRDTLVLVSNCPQLNNPCNAYNPTPVQLLVWDA
jgi:urea carboxylase-associated protein 1